MTAPVNALPSNLRDFDDTDKARELIYGGALAATAANGFAAGNTYTIRITAVIAGVATLTTHSFQLTVSGSMTAVYVPGGEYDAPPVATENPFDAALINANAAFFGTFGIAATLTPPGGAGQVVTVILGTEAEDWDSQDMQQGKVFSRDCSIAANLAALAVKGATVAADGYTYTVKPPTRRDAAMITVRISRTEDLRRANAERYRGEGA